MLKQLLQQKLLKIHRDKMLKKIFITFMMCTQIYSAIDIDAFGIDKEALFIGACLQENFTLAKQLYDAGVNPAKIETRVGGQGSGYLENVIFRFIINDKVDVVKFLIETCKIDVNTKKFYINNSKDGICCGYGENLLIYALQHKAFLTAEYLLTLAELDVNYVAAHEYPTTALNVLVQQNVCVQQLNSNTNFLNKLLNCKNINLSPILKNNADNIFEKLRGGFAQPQLLECLEKILMHKDFKLVCLPQKITEFRQFGSDRCGWQAERPHILNNGGIFNNLLLSRKSIVDAVKYKNLKMINFLLNSNEVQDKQILDAYREAQLLGYFDIIEIFQNYFKEKQGLISTVVIPNNTGQQMSVLNDTEVPAQSKSVITTEISKI
jgi:hypothetical protein